MKEGIGEVLEDYSPITDYSDHFELYFLDYNLDGKPKYDEKECRDRDATYALPLRVKVRLVNKDTEEIIDQEVFMGDFPLMTDNGSFIINGAERVIVSQLVRSPGVYNGSEMDKSGRQLFNTTVIPSRGAWLEFEQDSQNVLWVRVDRTRKLTATVLLRALGFGSDEELTKNNFVEVKNSIIGSGTKASHLAYIGDVDIGSNCNIGCGAIFVNYNGKTKNRSVIGNDCFIGSNVNVIAPVNIADSTYVCAGSTISIDTEPKDFVIARAREIVKHNYSDKYKK